MTESSTALRIHGPARLHGEVSVTGAKNSALKLMAASLLAPGKNTLRNVPDIADVGIMSELLRRLGCAVEFDPTTNIMTIDVPQIPAHIAEYDFSQDARLHQCARPTPHASSQGRYLTSWWRCDRLTRSRFSYRWT